MTTDIHLRRQDSGHISLTCRAFDGIYDVRLTGSCSCGGGLSDSPCPHVSAVLGWLVPGRPPVETTTHLETTEATETTEAAPMPEACVPARPRRLTPGEQQHRTRWPA
jgi:hypothetical protein